jgi:hypothetical protein
MTIEEHGNYKETKGRFHLRNRRRHKGKCLLGITEGNENYRK